jgi:sugar phosphate isomerase/epimerase
VSWPRVRALEDIMPSRRELLLTVAAGLAAPAMASMRAFAQPRGEIKTALNGTIGLQLWSLRKSLPTNLTETIAKVQAMGFRTVEAAGLWKHTVAEQRAALDAAGLRCLSAHFGLDRLSKDRDGAFAEAKALGATWIVCPWIPKEGNAVTREQMLSAADAFNAIAKAAKEVDLHFGYHCHGYEFVPAPEGMLFDTLARNTDAALVTFQIDVFHALLGGADPVALIEKFGSRVSSLHLKDLKKGFPIKAGTAIAPAEADVPLGTGQVDMTSVLRMAMKSGVSQYYIEDESDDPIGHIPQSVTFLERFSS